MQACGLSSLLLPAAPPTARIAPRQWPLSSSSTHHAVVVTTQHGHTRSKYYSRSCIFVTLLYYNSQATALLPHTVVPLPSETNFLDQPPNMQKVSPIKYTRIPHTPMTAATAARA